HRPGHGNAVLCPAGHVLWAGPRAKAVQRTVNEGNRPFGLARFRRAALHFVAGRAAQAVAMIGFTLIAVRVLPPSDFATYMLAFGLVEAGRPLVSLGLVPMLQQFLPDM
ncbi:hypothetical protein RZS08_41250, partial [Arthrospira platensis SPKY1]|nr:hypothetical protein [Arthrospira platensis SPKY1]